MFGLIYVITIDYQFKSENQKSIQIQEYSDKKNLKKQIKNMQNIQCTFYFNQLFFSFSIHQISSTNNSINFIPTQQTTMKEENTTGKRVMTETEKKGLMWNIIQPGDPYDIRKSMIANLPGQSKFMGPHLQLVCLLQAAEIQRLCLFLQEHKVKLRQSDRLELDRHSYEVQIKELTEKLTDLQTYKRQNEKLKQYIRKQTIELEQLQKQQNNIGLTTKYQNSLRQIHSLIVEKEKLQENSQSLEKQINSLKQQNQFIQQAKIRQLQVLSKEIEHLNNMKIQQELKSRQKSNKWDIEKRKLQMQLVSLNKKYQQVFQTFKDLENANQVLKRQLDKAKYQAGKVEQYKKTLKDYEERFVKVAQEIDRLNDVLKQKSRFLNQQYQKSKQLAEDIRFKEEQLAQKDNNINELQKSNAILQRQQREALIGLEQNKIIIKSYETSLSQFSIEVERLNNILLKKQSDIQDLKLRNTQFEKKTKALEISQRQSAQYKVKYGQIIKKIADAELQNSRLQHEVQRLRYELQKTLQQKNEAQIRIKNYDNQFENLKGTLANLSTQIDRKHAERQSQIENEYLAEIQKLNEIINNQKQTNIENEQKIGYYLRQIKLLQSQLREKQVYSKLFRSYYDSTQQIKGLAVSAQNKQEYINDIKKKILMLQLQLRNVESPQVNQSGYQSQQQKTEFTKGDTFKTPEQQIEHLKDLLLSRQIQNNRLAEINEQLRQMIDNKQRSHQSPYSQGKGQQEKSSRSFSPGIKQITKMQTQPIRKKQPKDWGIQIEQQISLSKQQNLQDYPQRPYKDIKQGQGIQIQVPPHRILDKSKHKKQTTEKGQSQYSYQISQQRQRYPYSPSQQSPQPQSYIGTYEVYQQSRLRKEEYPQIIPQYSIFKKFLQERQHKQQTPEQMVEFKQKYQELLSNYESFYQSHYRLKHQIRYLQEQKQSNESYINLLTDKIQLLNNQISQLKQIIDPRLYQQNQENQLKKSYSLLLQKYNNAVFDNDIMRTKLKNIRGSSPKQGTYNQGQIQLRRLYAENEELKANCAQFSQYYNKILMVNDQLQRVNKILLDKERQIKAKETTIRDYEVQQLNYQNQIQQMNKKLFELTGQSKINQPLTIQNQSDKLYRQLNLLRKRNTELQRIVKSYELDQQQPRIQNDVSNQEKKKWQNQMQLMSLQITRLNSLLLNKKKDIQVLQQQNKSLSRNFSQSKRSSRVYQDNSNSIIKYEEKIVMLSQELQRLNTLLRIKQQNHLNLKNQLSQYQDLTKKQLSAYASETDRLNEQVSNLRIEVQKIRTKDQSGSQNGKGLLGSNISDYQVKIVELARQIDRLNKILATNRQQINDLNSKDNKYRSQIERLNNSLRLKVEESIMAQTKEKAFIQQKKILTRQIQEKTKQYEELNERYRVLQEENNKFSHHLKEYQKRIKSFYEESQRLQKIIQLLKDQGSVQGDESITQLIQKNRYLIQQIERLNEVIYKQRQQLSELRLNLADETSLQRRINEDLALFVVLFAEIESLRNRVIEQQNQVQKLHKAGVALRKA